MSGVTISRTGKEPSKIHAGPADDRVLVGQLEHLRTGLVLHLWLPRRASAASLHQADEIPVASLEEAARIVAERFPAWQAEREETPVVKASPKNWRKRIADHGYTLRSFAKSTGVPEYMLSQLDHRYSPKAQAAVAIELECNPWDIWPDRYHEGHPIIKGLESDGLGGLYEVLRARGTTRNRVSQQLDMHSSDIYDVDRRHMPALEARIAAHLGMEPRQIWPDRYVQQHPENGG